MTTLKDQSNKSLEELQKEKAEVLKERKTVEDKISHLKADLEKQVGELKAQQQQEKEAEDKENATDTDQIKEMD